MLRNDSGDHRWRRTCSWIILFHDPLRGRDVSGSGLRSLVASATGQSVIHAPCACSIPVVRQSLRSTRATAGGHPNAASIARLGWSPPRWVGGDRSRGGGRPGRARAAGSRPRGAGTGLAVDSSGPAGHAAAHGLASPAAPPAARRALPLTARGLARIAHTRSGRRGLEWIPRPPRQNLISPCPTEQDALNRLARGYERHHARYIRQYIASILRR